MSKKIVNIKSTPEMVAFKDTATACGVNPQIIEALMKRLSLSINNNKSYSPKEALEQIDSKIAMALDCMDDFTFANASLKELGIYFGIMVDKGQLLRGQPTQILSVEERKNITQLIPALLKEAQRRGITIDAEPIHERALTTVLPSAE